jgi:hypothetical protein
MNWLIMLPSGQVIVQVSTHGPGTHLGIIAALDGTPLGMTLGMIHGITVMQVIMVTIMAGTIPGTIVGDTHIIIIIILLAELAGTMPILALVRSAGMVLPMVTTMVVEWLAAVVE